MFDPTVLRAARETVPAPEERSMRILEWAISIGTLVFAVALTVFRA